jgi:HSP20 family protein
MVEKSYSAATAWPSLWEPFRTFGARLADWVAPAAEASADEAAYRIAMELPGVAEADIELSVVEGVVTVRGEKRGEPEAGGATWYFSERQFGSFSRSFRLPPDADEAAAAAALKDGVLTVTVPKRAPAAPEGARRVPIARG